MIRRRDLLTLVAATFAPNSAARAASSRPRLAILALGSSQAYAFLYAGLRDGLRTLGYVEGQTLEIDERHADGDVTRLKDLARDLLRTNPNVIFADLPSAAVAAHTSAPSLPVVCPLFSDSLIPKLAASYAHPAGSVTGLSDTVEGMIGKLVEVALDAIPGTTRIALLLNPSSVDAALYQRQIATAAQARGLSVVIVEAATDDEVRAVFPRVEAAKVQALIEPGNALFIAMESFIVGTALNLRVPLIFDRSSGARAGGLASYGVDVSDNVRRAAGYIDKILKGTAPGDLPIEFPTKFDLAVNLKTAKGLGITVPPALLARATEVIE